MSLQPLPVTSCRWTSCIASREYSSRERAESRGSRVESWRAKLLHRKLRLHGYDARLRRTSPLGEWQVILPIVSEGSNLTQVHVDRAMHDRERELRTVKLRDVTGMVRTVRVFDVAEQF